MPTFLLMIGPMKRFSDLREDEVLALAVTSEEEDSRIYLNFAQRLRDDYPATAQMFEEMAAEEQEHKNMLLELYRQKFGDRMPYITRQDVSGFLKRRPLWLMEKLRIETVRRQAAIMEIEASQFYADAATRAQDVDVRKLLGDLALTEKGHEARAAQIEEKNLSTDHKAEEDAIARRLFVLQIVQPGLAGLIDGSISTMAPIFAAAFATQNSMDAFLVGMAASLGAGISMGITEAMSDDGAVTGRGHPWVRGTACGVMTAVGGLGHTLPYLITDFWTATTVAGIVVAIELWAIAWLRWKYMDTPFVSAMVQVILGGILVLLTGILIGSA
jgi:rubrerythrin